MKTKFSIKKSVLQFYQCIAFLLFFNFFGWSQTSVPFATSGTWTCPVGVTSVSVEARGGGGGGGGTAAVINKAGGGGAGGSYVKNTSIAVVPGTIYTVTVGAGGAGGGASSLTADNSTAGGSSSFSGGVITTLTAVGGARGTYVTTNGQGGNGSTTGNVGFSVGLNFQGGNGANGSGGIFGGGGGSSAGNASSGLNATTSTGGTATIGQGGGNGANGPTTSAVGVTGALPGGGGSGGLTVGSTARAGGAGGAGRVDLTFTAVGPTLTLISSMTSFTTSNLVASASQSFTISGANMTNDVSASVGGSSNFELSSNNATWGSSTTITYGTSTLNATTIFVRLKAGLSYGTKASEDITVTSTNASNVTVAVAGFVNQNYYYKGTGDLNVTSSWSSTINGLGSSPSNFIAQGQIFNILTNAATSATVAGWTVSGTDSKIVLGASGASAVTLIVTSGFPITGIVDITAASSGTNTLEVAHSAVPTFGVLNPTSTVDIKTNLTYALPTLTTFGNLTVSNGAVLSLSTSTSRTIAIYGNFDVSAGTLSTSGSVSTIILNFFGAGKSIKSSSSSSYSKVTSVNIKAGASYALASDFIYLATAARAMTIEATGTLNISGFTLDLSINPITVSGTLTDNATSVLKSSVLTATGTGFPASNTYLGTVQYGALTGGQTIESANYNNLRVDAVSGTNSATSFTIGGTIISSFASVQATNGSFGFNGSTPQTLPAFFNANATATLTINNSTGVTLAATNAIPVGFNVTLAGGKLVSGGFSDQMGTLSLSNDSQLDVSGANHTVKFAASNLATWLASKTLSIIGWTGSTGNVFFGNSTSGLTSTQLSVVSFAGYAAGVSLLGTGELTPPVSSISSSSSMTSFTATTVAPSASQLFTVLGSNLVDDVVLNTAINSNFEISLDNSTFSNTRTIPLASFASNAAVAVYVRLKSGLSIGLKANENITLSSSPASDNLVVVAGLVNASYFYNGTSAVHEPASWGTSTNGTGTNPANFTDAYQLFNIQKDATTTAVWAVAGTGSKIILGSPSVASVTLTIGLGASITGPLDVTSALSSGSNRILVKDNFLHSFGLNIFTQPTWGTISPNTNIEFDGTTNAVLGGTNNLFNKTIKNLTLSNGAIARINSVNNNNLTINGQLFVKGGTTFYTGTISSTYVVLPQGASALINGTIVIEKLTGFTSNDAVASNSSASLNFTGTPDLTLGSNSIVEFTRNASSGTTQTITARTDYRNLSITSSLTGMTGTSARSFAGITDISGTLTVTTTGASNITAAGTVTAGSIVYNGAAAQTILGASFLTNTTSPISITNNSGVVLGATNVISDFSNIVLTGGTLRTGATAGFSDAVGTLDLTENATIALGTGNHTLTFAGSRYRSWDATKTIIITGWSGTAGASGSAGKIMFLTNTLLGAEVAGLTGTQITQFVFDGYGAGNATLLASGELVPACIAPTDAGIISGSQTICENGDPAGFTSTSTASGGSGASSAYAYRWMSSIDNINWSFISSSSVPSPLETTYDLPSGLTQTTYYRRVVKSDCKSGWFGTELASNVLTVSVIPASDAGTASLSNSTICSGSASTVTLANNVGTIQWQSSLNGSTWADITGAIFSTLNTGSLITTTYFRAVVTNGGCSSASSNTAIVTVNPLSDAGIATSSNATICSGSATTINLANNVGTIQWQKSANGSTWINITEATASTLSTGNLTAITYYRALVTSGLCQAAISNTVNVNIITTATPTASSQTLPLTSTVANLVATGTTLKWYTAAVGGSALAPNTLLVNGTYYVSQTLNGCESVNRAAAVVTLFGIPLTKVRTNQCGVTLALLNSNINADVVVAAQKYRFEVTNGANVRLFETIKFNFNLTKIEGSTYDTTYGVRVAVQMGGIWGNYGASCNITTPSIVSSASIPVTDLRTTDCGSTLASIGSPIHSKLVYGATTYRFEITSGGMVTIYDSPIYYFFLTDMMGSTYGTTYSIRVAVNIAGTWGNYGAACTVTTPSLGAGTVLLTQIRPTFCGVTLAALNTKIPATLVYNAEGYRFEIITGGITTVYDSGVYNFRLADAGVVVANNTTYAIRVAARVNGIYGNYGVSCNVTTPAGSGSTRQAMAEAIDFDLVAFPNPSNSVFKLRINGASDDALSVLVFDMMGKQIENKVVNASEIEDIAIGQNYSSGIYNVIVSQGMNTKSVRVIKN